MKVEPEELVHFDLVVVGGGAAGFFGAIAAAEMKPGLSILILEKTTKLLSKWFESKNVKLKTEEDGRMFPETNNSQTIIDCFLNQAELHQIKIKLHAEVKKITPSENDFTLELSTEKIIARKVLIATGGYNNLQSYEWLKPFPVINPIPSLFTFNDSGKKFKDLMGVSVAQAEVKIAGTKFSETGPVLITH